MLHLNLFNQLAEKIHSKQSIIQNWHLQYQAKVPPPCYCSIDLRQSDYKIAPVDNNLYPAGFNNICPKNRELAATLFQKIIQNQIKTTDKTLKVLILPEENTSNAYYIENLYYLKKILKNAKFETKIGWYSSHPSPVELISHSKKKLKAYPIQIKNNILSIQKWTPNVILLNNDFSGEYPKILDSVSQPILPSHTLGWHSRKKSNHFKHYNQLAEEFANILEIDPWILQIQTQEISPIDFNQAQDREKIAEIVEHTLTAIQKKYHSYHIQQKPFVFIKNNAGTYGMGIMVAHSAQEVLQMNRRIKNKMKVGKNHSLIQSIIIQEGIPTSTLIQNLPAEPVLYLIGYHVVGGFFRTHPTQSNEANLNSKGMFFKNLCLSDRSNSPLELVYQHIAQVSVLAAGLEIQEGYS